MLNTVKYLLIIGLTILLSSCDKPLHYSIPENILLPVEKHGKWGYINQYGKLIVDYKYDKTEQYDKDFAIVRKNGQYYLIDKSGKLVFNKGFDTLRYNGTDYSADYLYVIRPKEKKIYNIGYDAYLYWKHDVYVVQEHDPYKIKKTTTLLFPKPDFDQKYGIADIYGNLLLKVDNPFIVIPNDEYFSNFKFPELLAKHLDSNIAIVKSQEQIGFYNIFRKELQIGKYDYVSLSFDGKMLVCKNNKFGLIDTVGNTLLECEYDRLLNSYTQPIDYNFETGKNEYLRLSEHYFGQNGEKTYRSVASLLLCYSDKYILAKKNNKFGYLNSDYEIHIDYKYDDGTPFFDGIAAVKKNGKWGVIDTLDNLILQSIYDDAKSPVNKEIPLKIADKWGILNSNGDTILNFKYDKITYRRENMPFKGNIITLKNSDSTEYYLVNKQYIFPYKTKLPYYWFYQKQWFNYPEMEAIRIGDNGDYSIIDTNGNYILKHDSVNSYSLYNPYKRYKYNYSIERKRKTKNGKYFSGLYPDYYLFDLEGNQVTNTVFYRLEYLEKGIIKATVKNNWGYINRYGGWIWKSDNYR